MADIELTETVLLGSPARILQYEPGSDVELTVSGGATPSATSEGIGILGVKEITLQVDHKRTGSDSTDLDVELYSSPDGTRWSDYPFASINVGADKISKPVPAVVPQGKEIRWKATNNDAGNATKVRPIVTIYKG